jgi:hypothetical protein
LASKSITDLSFGAKLSLSIVIALFLLLQGIAFEYGLQDASATQCVRFSPEMYYERSDVIFVGTVIHMDSEPRFLEHGQYVSLNVSKAWKGIDTKTVTVNAESGRFREGNEYLVYAERNFLAIEVTFCGGTIQTDTDLYVGRELSFLEKNYSPLNLKEGHTMSMNPFPLLTLVGGIAGIGIAAVGIAKSGITVQMLKKAVPVFVGLIVGIMFLWLVSSMTFPVESECYWGKSLEQVEKLSIIPVMVPTVLPEGYSYQGGHVQMGRGTIDLQYFTQPVCGPNYLIDFTQGVISLSASPLSSQRIPHNTSAAGYLDERLMQLSRDSNYVAERYTFADGREALAVTERIGNMYDFTHVDVIDETTGTWYSIDSTRSSDEAVSIAESLRERDFMPQQPSIN